jgi:hypothetical protein
MVYSLKKFFNDDLVIAVTSGILATLIKNCFSLLLWFFGLKHYLYWHLAASLFLENFNISILSLFIIGFLVDIAVAALLGIIFFYSLRLTGKQHAHLKAIFAGIFIWVGITGLSTRLGISGIDFTDPSTIFSFLTTDVLFAQLLTYFILYFGKDYLPLRQYPGLDKE